MAQGAVVLCSQETYPRGKSCSANLTLALSPFTLALSPRAPEGSKSGMLTRRGLPLSLWQSMSDNKSTYICMHVSRWRVRADEVAANGSGHERSGPGGVASVFAKNEGERRTRWWLAADHFLWQCNAPARVRAQTCMGASSRHALPPLQRARYPHNSEEYFWQGCLERPLTCDGALACRSWSDFFFR